MYCCFLSRGLYFVFVSVVFGDFAWLAQLPQLLDDLSVCVSVPTDAAAPPMRHSLRRRRVVLFLKRTLYRYACSYQFFL